MDKRYTYQEEIEQKRLWLERKIKRELKIVINAIIDKVIWKGCNLDVLILVFPELTRAIVHTNPRYQTEFPKRESQKLEADKEGKVHICQKTTSNRYFAGTDENGKPIYKETDIYVRR